MPKRLKGRTYSRTCSRSSGEPPSRAGTATGTTSSSASPTGAGGSSCRCSGAATVGWAGPNSESRSPAASGDGAAAGAVAEVERELHHVHLPKLDETGLVNYDVEPATAAYVGHDAIDDGRLLAD